MKKILVFTVLDEQCDSLYEVQTNLLSCYQTTDEQLLKSLEILNDDPLNKDKITKEKVNNISYYGSSRIFVKYGNQIYEIQSDNNRFPRQLDSDLLKNVDNKDILFSVETNFQDYAYQPNGNLWLKEDPHYIFWDNITDFIKKCKLTNQNLDYLRLINNLNLYGAITSHNDTKLPSFFVKKIKRDDILDYKNVIDKNIKEYEKISDYTKSLS